MKPILYARWSSQEQTRGSTLQRQLERGEAHCKAKGWDAPEVITDSGISAYTGANLKTGNLGKLTERLERDGGDNVAIVVEKLDRLSRQPPLVMSNWLQRVCATGAIVTTADGRHTITHTDLINNVVGVMGIIFEAFVGYEESKKKSDRGLENWRMKREGGKPLTAQCPAWLELSPDRSRYLEIDDRVTLVRLIFGETDRGVGKATLAARFNRGGVEPWGKGKRKAKKGWHASYIQKILRNSAVLGEHQHHRKQRAAKRTPEGDIVKGYYPAVIDPVLFERVNDEKRQRVVAQQGSSRRLANMFTGIARCAECNGIMTYRNKGMAKRSGGASVREDYLVCDNAIRSNGCTDRTHWNYAKLEAAMLDRILHLALDDQYFTEPNSIHTLELTVATKRRELSDLEHRTRKLMDRMEANDRDGLDDPMSEARHRQLLIEAKALRSGLVEAEIALEDGRGRVSPAEHLRRVEEVRALMEADDVEERYQARSRVKLALNDIVAGIIMDGGAGYANIMLVGSSRYISMARDGTMGADFPLVGAADLTPSESAALTAMRRREARGVSVEEGSAAPS